MTASRLQLAAVSAAVLTLALAMPPPSPAGVDWAGRNWAMSCDFADPKSDLKQVQIAGELCGPTCEAEPGCTHFTWSPRDDGTCVLKRGAVSQADAVTIDDKRSVCGVRLSLSPAAAPSVPAPLPAPSDAPAVYWNANDQAADCDFPGGTFKIADLLTDQCGATCSATPECTHFAWRLPESVRGICSLKRGIVAKKDAVWISLPGAICGLATGNASSSRASDLGSVSWNGLNWAAACDFTDPVRDFKQVQVAGEKCGSACDTEPSCSHFSWSLANNSTCKLKRGIVSKEDAVPVDDQTAVCGLSAAAAGVAASVRSATVNWNGGNVAPSCSFAGDIFRTVQISAEQCATVCDAVADCTHFNWELPLPPQLILGKCSLKRGVASKKDAVRVDSPGATCGMVAHGTDAASTSAISAAATPAPPVIDWKKHGSWAQGCEFTTRDFQQLQVPAGDCEPRCRATPGCTHFSWSQLNGGACRLMGGLASMANASAVVDNAALCGLVTAAPEKAIQWKRRSWAMGCDFADGHFQEFQAPGQECGPRCDAEPRCTHFAWTNLNGGTCRLKAGAATKDDAFPISEPSAVCGVRSDSASSVNWNGQKWTSGCYFRGGAELRSERLSSAELCWVTCEASSDCTHFTWTSQAGGTCWLKRGEISRENAMPVNDKNVFCGLKSSSSRIEDTEF